MSIKPHVRWLSILFLSVPVWLCIRWNNDRMQATHPMRSPQGSAIKQDELVSPYYEWVAKDYALSWVRKPDGSVVAVPLTGAQRAERRITGASDIRQMGYDRPYAMKISPDGSKILSFMGGPGSPPRAWRVGGLEGSSYVAGKLLPEIHSLRPVWKRSSKEWVTFIGSQYSIAVAHYYTDDPTPRIPRQLRNFASQCNAVAFGMPGILGLRQDGIAVVPSYGGYEATSVDLYMVDVDRDRVLPERRHIVLPKGRHTSEMTISHAGDQIAWLFVTEADPVVGGKHPQEESTEVWLSNSDGSNLKRLFRFAPIALTHTASDQKHIPRALRWTIDDTSVSCLIGNHLQLIKIK